MRGEDIQ
jgi:geranylgeranyl pyrophosphate synthase